MSVFFDNELDKPIPENYEEIVKDIIDATLDYLECPYECEINVIFTDNQGIQLINKEHRNIDSPTDVLSFPINDFLYGEGEISICNLNEEFDRLLLGDIVVSVPTMSRQAEEYGHGIERECAFLVCHGMLHLLGYDHMIEDDKKIMREMEEKIMNAIDLRRD